MKINLTKKQYRLLMERCFISDWIINAYRGELTPAMQEQEELVQYLLSHVKEFGAEENVTFAKDNQSVHWAADFTKNNPNVEDYIQHYNINMYADVLSGRLAEIALEERYSQEELEAMDPKELSKEFVALKQQALSSSALFQGLRAEAEAEAEAEGEAAENAQTETE